MRLRFHRERTLLEHAFLRLLLFFASLIRKMRVSLCFGSTREARTRVLGVLSPCFGVLLVQETCLGGVFAETNRLLGARN